MTDKELYATDRDTLSDENKAKWDDINRMITHAIKILEALGYEVRYREAGNNNLTK